MLLFSCVKRQTAGQAIGRLELTLADSLRLPAPAVALSLDQNGLLLPENSGTNIMRMGFDLQPGAPIALPERLARIQGMVADAFSIYLFSDNGLQRLSRASGTLTRLSTNVQYQGAAMLAGGELAFSDGFSNRILTLDPAGSMSDLNANRLAFKPSSLAPGRDNNLYVLNQALQEVTVFNRVGDMVRAMPLSAPCIKLAVDDSLSVYLLERTGNAIWRLNRRGAMSRATAEGLGMRFAGLDLVVHQDRLYLLDNGLRLLCFQLPEL